MKCKRGKLHPNRKEEIEDPDLVQVHNQWPNLKNLSGGLNLSRGLNMVGST